MKEVTSCTHCGDTYEIPQGMELNKEYQCQNCFKLYDASVRACKMPKMALDALKGEK